MYYAQNDYPDVKLGTSQDSIKQDGCVLIAFCNIANIDPMALNSQFIDQGGYADGELINWSRCAEIAGLDYQGIGNLPTIYPCIGCTDHYSSLGFPTHYFAIISPTEIVDSLDGKTKPISTYNIILVQNVTTKPIQSITNISPMDQEKLDRLNYLEGILKGIDKSEPLLTPDGKGHTVVTYQGEDQLRTVYGMQLIDLINYTKVYTVDILELNKKIEDLNNQMSIDKQNIIILQNKIDSYVNSESNTIDISSNTQEVKPVPDIPKNDLLSIIIRLIKKYL